MHCAEASRFVPELVFSNSAISLRQWAMLSRSSRFSCLSGERFLVLSDLIRLCAIRRADDLVFRRCDAFGGSRSKRQRRVQWTLGRLSRFLSLKMLKIPTTLRYRVTTAYVKEVFQCVDSWHCAGFACAVLFLYVCSFWVFSVFGWRPLH